MPWLQVKGLNLDLQVPSLIGHLPSRQSQHTTTSMEGYQCAKKVVSDSPGLVDFALGLVIFVLNLPDGQVLFWGEIQITEGL